MYAQSNSRPRMASILPPCEASTTKSASRVDRGMPWKFEANEPTSMLGMWAASRAANTATTCEHLGIAEAGMAMADAGGHDPAGAIEQTRTLQQLGARLHRPCPDRFLLVERRRPSVAPELGMLTPWAAFR